MDDIVIREGIDIIDFDKVTEMLAKSFWSPGIGIEEVKKGAYNSALVIGAFNHAGEQIGFARVISDKTRYAYILDVIVHEDYRHQGVGEKIIQAILESAGLDDVYQWQLITKDAHSFYRKFGFEPIVRIDDMLEIRINRSEKRNNKSERRRNGTI